jgi:GPN-loop GTPase
MSFAAGQIEVFVWSASGTILLESLASSFPTVIAYIVDTPRTASTSTFMSNMLYACSILYKTKLPMILVFNKTDVRSADFAKEWMTDYDAFQSALREDEDNNAFGGNEGSGDGGGMGSGYMGSLLNSMSMMLEEFYRHLSVVGVSSMTGQGVDDFFAAVAEKVEEFQRDYQPELDKRREERDDKKRKARQRELDKLMKGMTIAGSSAPADIEEKEPAEEDDDDEDIESEDQDEDDENVAEDDREGLQARYEALAGGNVEADASFAKFLHSQR